MIDRYTTVQIRNLGIQLQFFRRIPADDIPHQNGIVDLVRIQLCPVCGGLAPVAASLALGPWLGLSPGADEGWQRHLAPLSDPPVMMLWVRKCQAL